MKLGGHLEGTEEQVPTEFGPNRPARLGGGARGTRRAQTWDLVVFSERAFTNLFLGF